MTGHVTMISPEDSSLLRFGALPEVADKVVILLHGRGSSAKGIARLADALPSGHVAYLAPSARGGTWYPMRFLSPLAMNEPALTAALTRIRDLIAGLEATGIGADRIGLAGFSQGACLALEFVARNPRRYAFVAALSGALMGPLDAAAREGDLAGTPILVGCAENDAHIPRAHVEKSATELAQMNASVTKQLFSGDDHTVFPPEVRWLQEQLGA